MNRKQLEMLLGALTVIVAFFAWLSVRSAIIVPHSSTWIVPMALFFTYLVLLCLDMLLFRELLLLELVLFVSLLLSLPFAFTWLQMGAILLSGYFLFLSSRKVAEDMDLNIRISVWKSLQAGKSYLVIAMTMLISMQYFVTINSFDGEKRIPNFDVSFITQKIAIPFISSVNPQFKALKDDTLTVDQFILQTQNTNQSNEFSAQDEAMLDAQIPPDLTPEQVTMIKKQAMDNFVEMQSQLIQKNQELILEIGRKQLSDVVGTPVNGDQKISELFTGMINNRINDYFNPKIGGSKKNPVFSMILAIVLFLTIYPIGLLLCVPIFLIAKLAFVLLRKTDNLKVRMISVMKEILE